MDAVTIHAVVTAKFKDGVACENNLVGFRADSVYVMDVRMYAL